MYLGTQVPARAARTIPFSLPEWIVSSMVSDQHTCARPSRFRVPCCLEQFYCGSSIDAHRLLYEYGDVAVDALDSEWKMSRAWSHDDCSIDLDIAGRPGDR
jgi:hypothetical protein